MSVRRLIARVGDRVRGIPIQHHVDALERSASWSSDRLRAVQEEKLARLLEHCYRHVPYYRERFRATGTTPADFATLERFRDLPILTKSDYKTNAASLVAEVTPYGKVRASTGGSTGAPLTFYIDKNTWAVARASLYVAMGRLGYRFGDPIVALTGGSLGRARPSKRTRLKNALRRKWEIPAFSLNRDTFPAYAERLRRAGELFLRGYPTSAAKLAELWADTNTPPLRLRGVFTTGETLHPHHRERIESTFQTRVMDTYGCGEVNGVAYQCPDGDRYHVFDEHVILEVDGDEAVMTDLDNYAMPVLRYRNGDRLLDLGAGCRCGVTRTTFARVLGRTAEKMVTKGGETLDPLLFPHVFKHVQGVQEYQVLFRRGELVKIRVVPSGGTLPAETIATMHELFREVLPGDLAIEIDVVDRLEHYPSGKNRFIHVETA